MALLLAGFAFVAAISPIIQQNLNRSATESVSGQYLGAVDSYFSPLFQFMSTASLWSNIGNIESLGEPDLYVESLHQSLEILGSASAMSLQDAEGRELVFRLGDDGEYYWYETDSGSDDSLVSQRRKQNITYMNLSDVGEYSTFFGEYPVWFRLSLPYELPGDEGRGMTIRGTIGNRDSKNAMTLWLDLPSGRMSQYLEFGGRYSEATIFMVLPGDEFMLFSAGDLDSFISKHGVTGDYTVQNIRDIDRDFIVQALDLVNINEKTRSSNSRFTYNDRQWQADYRNLRIGTQDITLGIFIPVDSLWTADLYLPVQIAVLLILLVATSLLFVLIRDFRANATRVSDVEIMEKLITGGESSSLEFKSSLRWDYRQGQVNKDLEGVIMKSVAAFSNSEGGMLLIGLDDSGTPLGLEPDYSSLKESGRDYYELHLRTLLIGQYGNELASRGVKVDFVSLNSKDICRIEVVKGTKPLYTRLASKSGSPTEKFFVRSGNSSRAISSLSEITSFVVNRFGKRAVE